MDTKEIKTKIDDIIVKRRKLLPQVDENITAIKTRIANLKSLLNLLGQLESIEKNEEIRREVYGATASLTNLHTSLQGRIERLEILKTRFTRDTVNIGVSGEARVGKSTTLQKFTGLSNTQIPTGDALPVTAVRSEIYNSTDEYADITFRDPVIFVDEYIKPYLDIVNEVSSEKIVINSLSDLRVARLPESLGNNIDSITTDALNKLRDAQKGIETYSSYLTGGSQKFALSNIEKFVAYPKNEELKTEESGGDAADRAYLAVKSVKIYCNFPNLSGVKIGLIDLPGLGEIGASVADMHLHGLEDGVDQILLVMKPTKADAHAKQSILTNVDQLRKIQPGISKRGELITAGINVEKGVEQSASILKDSFERLVNSAQESDRIDVREYEAINSTAVATLFDHLLEKIGANLPKMDQEVFDYVLDQAGTDSNIDGTLEELKRTMNRILKIIPVPRKLLLKQINEISRAIIDDYNKYEYELSKSSKSQSAVYKEFVEDVERIHQAVKTGIQNGFFKETDVWKKEAEGQKDYLNYYRDEAKRIRREIIASYDHLNEFYITHVDGFKLRIIQIFLGNAGNLKDVFNLKKNESPNSCIDAISSELSSTIKDDDLEAALSLLKSVSFSFRNNVFLQISQHLDNLMNPIDIYQIDSKTHESKSKILGSISDVDAKINKLKLYLTKDANEANDSIKEALLKSDDRFNEYLYVCLSFFIDFLYRKNDENFKQIVVGGLIEEYRDFIFGEKEKLEIDQDKGRLINQIKETIQAIQSGNAFEVEIVEGSVAKSQQSKDVEPKTTSKQTGKTQATGYSSNYKQKW
ncbi:hypothetical protein AGMMS49983_07090 [Clostridia bacterium]|nr:hypothetical protein AGMMS49983_07090 [Clostridia bacterium]